MWLKNKFPEKYWHIYQEKKPDGTPAVRENKKHGLLAVYKEMKIKKYQSLKQKIISTLAIKEAKNFILLIEKLD